MRAGSSASRAGNRFLPAARASCTTARPSEATWLVIATGDNQQPGNSKTAGHHFAQYGPLADFLRSNDNAVHLTGHVAHRHRRHGIFSS
ncbi:hypothetical protein SBA3_2050003 [Candidatus Sulfopaludibacter sp. SbA3]|nr:hypothetical protein SBA3_2050003 [Candidatus Sulfopaludibacter sp. SbA3]